MSTYIDGDDNFSTSGYLKTNTALSDASVTLTAPQLKAGEFTITPTTARTITLPIAVTSGVVTGILDNAGWTVDGQNYEITIVNNAAFDVTLAVGTGATIVGSAVINNGSATWRVRRSSGTTVNVVRL